MQQILFLFSLVYEMIKTKKVVVLKKRDGFVSVDIRKLKDVEKGSLTNVCICIRRYEEFVGLFAIDLCIDFRLFLLLLYPESNSDFISSSSKCCCYRHSR